MADSKISALPASTTPLAGTEVLPIVQSSATKQVSVADLTAGRAISATQLTLTTGNLIVASGQGIDFSATSGTGTSELFNDYEEGNWTPTQGGGLTVIGAFSSSGKYVKTGSVVVVSGQVAAATSVAIGGAGGIMCGGLPFTTSRDGNGSANNNNSTAGIIVQCSGTSIYADQVMAATPLINFTATYLT